MLNSVGQVQVTLQLVQLTSSNQKFGIYTGDSLGCPFFCSHFCRYGTMFEYIFCIRSY